MFMGEQGSQEDRRGRREQMCKQGKGGKFVMMQSLQTIVRELALDLLQGFEQSNDISIVWMKAMIGKHKIFCVYTSPPFLKSAYSVKWLYTHTIVNRKPAFLQELKIFQLPNISNLIFLQDEPIEYLRDFNSFPLLDTNVPYVSH